MKELIQLRVNGRTHELAAAHNDTLLDVLRRDLALTSTKLDCEDASCGACAVLMDGVAVLACTLLAASCQEVEIVTAEGLIDAGQLNPVQKAFVEAGAATCPFCAPALVISAQALLDRNPEPGDPEICAAVASVACRCGGRERAVDAVKLAAKAETA